MRYPAFTVIPYYYKKGDSRGSNVDEEIAKIAKTLKKSRKGRIQNTVVQAIPDGRDSRQNRVG